MSAFVSPPVVDPTARAVDLTPPILRAEPWLSVVRALLTPLAQIDAEMADYVRQIADPSAADGEALDAVASWVGQTCGGLSTLEYRRIVLGAIAAAACRREWRHDRAMAMWLAVTGSEAADAQIRTLEPVTLAPLLSSPVLRMEAVIPSSPTRAYLDRLAGVVSSAVPTGMWWSAVLHVPGSLVLDGSPGLDAGLLAWYRTGVGGIR